MLALEFEYTTTVSEDDDYGGSGSSGSAQTLGFFVVARTPGDLYAKGRLGYSRVAQEFDDIPAVDWGGEKNVYGVAAGVSVGYKIMKGGAIELEYMLYPTRDDVEFSSGATTIEEDLEMDFVAINYIWSFE